MSEYKVIDISKYQGAVDFKKVKASGVAGVIIRCGYTGYGKGKTKNADSRWETNYAAAKAAGLPVGTYYYSCAVTEAEAKAEANFVLELIKGKALEYPVYWDTEDNHNTAVYAPQSQLSIGKTKLTAVGSAFLSTLRSAGIYCGIYASTSWLNNQLDMAAFSAYDVWVAQYASRVTYKGKYQMWQYSSAGSVNGINGNVDLNRCYVDYPAIISGDNTDKLKIGDRSPAVFALKMLLCIAKQLGIITAGTDDNNIFGNGTRSGVIQLQQKAGLTVTGEAGGSEMLALRRLILEKAEVGER